MSATKLTEIVITFHLCVGEKRRKQKKTKSQHDSISGHACESFYTHARNGYGARRFIYAPQPAPAQIRAVLSRLLANTEQENMNFILFQIDMTMFSTSQFVALQ